MMNTDIRRSAAGSHVAGGSGTRVSGPGDNGASPAPRRRIANHPERHHRQQHHVDDCDDELSGWYRVAEDECGPAPRQCPQQVGSRLALHQPAKEHDPVDFDFALAKLLVADEGRDAGPDDLAEAGANRHADRHAEADVEDGNQEKIAADPEHAAYDSRPTSTDRRRARPTREDVTRCWGCLPSGGPKCGTCRRCPPGRAGGERGARLDLRRHHGGDEAPDGRQDDTRNGVG